MPWRVNRSNVTLQSKAEHESEFHVRFAGWLNLLSINNLTLGIGSSVAFHKVLLFISMLL